MAAPVLPPPGHPLPFLPGASWPELAWVAVALVGLVHAVSNFMEARGDLRVQEGAAAPSAARLLVARGNVRREGVRVFVLLCLLAIGALAALSPPRPPVGVQSLSVWLSPLLLIAVMVALTASSWRDRITRRDLRELLRPVEGRGAPDA